MYQKTNYYLYPWYHCGRKTTYFCSLNYIGAYPKQKLWIFAPRMWWRIQVNHKCQRAVLFAHTSHSRKTIECGVWPPSSQKSKRKPVDNSYQVCQSTNRSFFLINMMMRATFKYLDLSSSLSLSGIERNRDSTRCLFAFPHQPSMVENVKQDLRKMYVSVGILDFHSCCFFYASLTSHNDPATMRN